MFVCLSRHEGFLVPLLEAWHHRVPVVAFGATAVPETLGGAGLLLSDASCLPVAAAVARVLHDRNLADALRAAGLARLEELSLSRAQARLIEIADGLAAGRWEPTGLARFARPA